MYTYKVEWSLMLVSYKYNRNNIVLYYKIYFISFLYVHENMWIYFIRFS